MALYKSSTDSILDSHSYSLSLMSNGRVPSSLTFPSSPFVDEDKDDHGRSF